MKAEYVFEANHVADDRNGPITWGRIGFAIDGRVFWMESYSHPGTDSASYNRAIRESKEIVAAINAAQAAAIRSGDV